MSVRFGFFALSALGLSTLPAYAQLSDIGNTENISAEFDSVANEQGASDADPWEGFNRKMFAVHNVFDDIILIPAAKAYRATTPKPARKGLRNFLANARSPVILVNDLLQGEWSRAGDTASRFIVNSTIGFGGAGDPAKHMGVERHAEDFGQTLAVWGVSPGPYLFLPLFGPSTLRDGFGAAVDTGLDPLFYVRTNAASVTRYSRTGATGLSVREPLLEPIEDIQEKSLDYYASFRSFYLQSRRREINNGRTNYEDLPDIGDFEEFDEIQ